MTDLDTAKRRLSDVLKDDIQKYWDLMKSWYRRKITKESFDSKAKALLGESSVHLHNEFLFAILVKCQTGDHPDAPQPATTPFPPPQVVPPPPSTSVPAVSSSKASPPPPPPPPPPASVGRPKLKKQRRLSPPTEIPYGALNALQYHVPPQVQITASRDLDSIMLCAHDLMLPDFPTLHTRMLLGAWESGLDGVSEESAKLLLLSLQCYLKNVIQTLIAHQCSWRFRKNGQFQHSFGTGLSSTALAPSSLSTARSPPPSNPESEREEEGDVDSSSKELMEVREISTVKSVTLGEAELAMVASRGTPVKQLEPLTLFHLRDALMMNRQCIPVHSVYVCNMERISALMWHPSKEEEEQQKTVEQWRKSLQTKPPFTIMTTTNTMSSR